MSDSSSWVAPFMLVVGLVSVLVGVCVRAGGCRRALRYYFVPDLPAQLHNGALAMIPLGLAFLLVGIGFGMYQSAPALASPADRPPDGPFLGFGVLSLLTGIWWIVRPPGWIKPAWLRAEEQAIRAGMPVPDRGDRPYSPRAYAFNWLGLIVGSAVWLKVGLPVGPLFLGLSTGIALQLANRPGRPNRT